MRRTVVACVVAYGTLMLCFWADEALRERMPWLLGLRPSVWSLIVGVPCVGLAWLLVVRAGRSRAALTMAALVTLAALVNGGIGMTLGSFRASVVGAAAAAGVPSLITDGLLAHPGGLAFTFLLATLVLLSSEFPDASAVLRASRPRWLQRPAILFGIALVVWLVAGATERLPASWNGAVPFLKFGGFLALLAALALAGRWLWQNFRAATPDERRHALWVVLGVELATFVVLAVFLGAALFELPGEVLVATLIGAPLLLALGVAIATFYSGTFDPTLTVRRTTAYGAFVLIAAVVFGAAQDAVSGYVVGHVGLPDSASVWLTSGFSVVVLGPVFARLRRTVHPLEANAGRATSGAAALSASGVRRSASVLALLLFGGVGPLAACDEDGQSPDPEPIDAADVVGTWDLKTINGQQLPVLVFGAGTDSIWLLEEWHSFSSDGSYDEGAREEVVRPTRRDIIETGGSGSWAVEGDSILVSYVYWDYPTYATFRLDDGVLTSKFHQTVKRYARRES